MKKYALIIGMTIMLSGCSQLDQYINVGTDATPQEKFRACALSEAQAKLKAGTLFAQSMTETKDEIVNTCIKKLALEAAGIDSEAQSIAVGILNNLYSAQ